MQTYIYLSLMPESLIVSMLPPAEFGTYLATGTLKRSREQAVYFTLNEEFQDGYFNLAKARELCVPHENGRPKHSVYISIYRVLEHVPPEALGKLWLATRDGRTLALEQAPASAKWDVKYHLYQELCPVHPLIASSLDPLRFAESITDPQRDITLPAICFADMALADLADNPQEGSGANLPYNDLQHLKDCLDELVSGTKTTKTINRIQPSHVPYRCISGGFFVGNHGNIRHYPFPSPGELDRNHHEWWRSATLS